MMRKFATVLAALAFGLTTLAPASASAQHYRGGHDRSYHGGGQWNDGCRRDNHYGCERDRDRRRYGHDDDDALAAGVIGLVLGAVVATAIANSNNRDDGYYDDGDRYGDRYGDQYGYRGPEDERYAPPPPPEPQCTRTERQWDRYANRYVMVDVPC
ncbi:MAG: hypothetical protein KF779_17155 [Hyphomonadaceae bacterium]|nr:hypothetical protein [Hyphomonadaceae bacterium]